MSIGQGKLLIDEENQNTLTFQGIYNIDDIEDIKKHSIFETNIVSPNRVSALMRRTKINSKDFGYETKAFIFNGKYYWIISDILYEFKDDRVRITMTGLSYYNSFLGGIPTLYSANDYFFKHNIFTNIYKFNEPLRDDYISFAGILDKMILKKENLIIESEDW
ncbi:hypothetical protein P872_18400 [Rhodonellum psychrophilum GCM71 = DSM 17998]|uniref:Uncharacterized protein n=2 Tax=Rhodonellum TaxID=336827 RepID=U5BXT6_9BACT|nr:hypothetical protein P872_18400 [Rhodonellum psychrophilum GCM71 = DSM 17998]